MPIQAGCSASPKQPPDRWLDSCRQGPRRSSQVLAATPAGLYGPYGCAALLEFGVHVHWPSERRGHIIIEGQRVAGHNMRNVARRQAYFFDFNLVRRDALVALARFMALPQSRQQRLLSPRCSTLHSTSRSLPGPNYLSRAHMLTS